VPVTVPSLPAFDGNEPRTFLGERSFGESLQQRQHAVFHARTVILTSPDVQFLTRCSCKVHQATSRDLERERPTVEQFSYTDSHTG
jgi:hypothetical protein